MQSSSCLLALLLGGLTACAIRPALPVGKYVEDPDPGLAIFMSKSLRLLPGQQFEYYMYSDSAGLGLHGAGTYQLQGRQLRLLCNGQELNRASSVQVRTRPSLRPDSLTLTFQVWAVWSVDAPRPLVGATILARDTTVRGPEQASTSADANGRATLRLARQSQKITIYTMSWHPIFLPCPTSDADYEVYMRPDLGVPYAAGTVLEFRVLRQTANRLVLRRGNVTTTLARQAPK